MAKKEEYGVEAIRVLKGLEPVKQRPGMYTLTDNPLHIIQEVIDNASDEVLAGYGKRISVEVAAALLFVVLWLVLADLVSLVLPESLADMDSTLLPVYL